MGRFICILICFGIPMVSFLYFFRRKNGCLRSFLTGMGVFAVFQLFTRIPLVSSVLPQMDWFLVMSITSPILTMLFYAFTAGLFEEVGRYLGFISLGKREITWIHGLAFGLGHGGIEALWIGMKVCTADVGQLNYLTAGLERLFTMGVHIGLTFVVLRGIREKKRRFLLIAVLLHTLLDLIVPFISVKSGNLLLTEGIVFVWGCAGIFYAWKEKRRYCLAENKI